MSDNNYDLPSIKATITTFVIAGVAIVFALTLIRGCVEVIDYAFDVVDVDAGGGGWSKHDAGQDAN